jgi:hypothetical protein
MTWSESMGNVWLLDEFAAQRYLLNADPQRFQCRMGV